MHQSLLRGLACFFIVSFLLTSCDLIGLPEIVQEEQKEQERYVVSSGVVQNHFSSKAQYSNTNREWTLDINTDLQNVYEGASIKLGFEIYHSSDLILDLSYDEGDVDQVYYVNSYGEKISDNIAEVVVADYKCHANVYLSVIMENTIAENAFFWGTIKNLDARLQAGDKLTQAERDLYNSLKKKIEENNLKWMRQMKGRCFVMVDGNKYYKEFFTIPSQYLK